MRLYILNADHQPEPVADTARWGLWMERNRLVRLTEFADGSRVSTVFLGLDHDWGGHGPPVLWESMYFSAHGTGEAQWRYTTHEAALAGHQRLVDDLVAQEAVAIVAPTRAIQPHGPRGIRLRDH